MAYGPKAPTTADTLQAASVRHGASAKSAFPLRRLKHCLQKRSPARSGPDPHPPAGAHPGKPFPFIPLFHPMALYTCWNGRSNVLFSSEQDANNHAEEVIISFGHDCHPMGAASVSELVSQGPPCWWYTPPHTREDGAFIGAEEAPPCEPGDDSDEVAQAVAALRSVREAAWNAS